MKTLVTYTYFETPRSRPDLEFHAEVGMAPDERTTYVVVVNGGACSVPLAERPDRVILRRDNIGFDFGAYRHALAHLSERFGSRVEELPFGPHGTGDPVAGRKDLHGSPPSRQGTYDGIPIHPFEVVFHEWYWSHHPHQLVAYDYSDRHRRWKLEQVRRAGDG